METIYYLHLYKYHVMKDQLLKLIESEGLTPAKLADEIGVQRSSISHILSDRNKPSYDFILKILNRFTGINAEWLITGKGNMIKGENSALKGENPISKKVIQNDLFSSFSTDNSQKKNIMEDPRNTLQNSPQNLYKESNIKAAMEKKESDPFNKFTNVNNVNFIVTFYQDGTFEKFIPRG
jgi:transcriptional regulator with XRE-family HTH domain